MDIDFVTTYVDMNDLVWQNLYKKTFKCKNIKNIERYRDYGMLKYQLRSIEKFMPWIRNVILILQSPSQIPNWLNIKHPKLRIVYHKDYIPKEFLPTFNSNVIEMFIHNIKDLSENFILANDDMLAVSPIREDFFFKNGKPVYKKTIKSKNFRLLKNGIFDHTLFNNMTLERKVSKFKNRIQYENKHQMTPYNLSFWKKSITRFKNEISQALTKSPKRNIFNINHWLIRDLALITNEFINDPERNERGYISVNDTVTIEQMLNTIKNSKTACLNDCFKEKYRGKDIANVLETILNQKSYFEV